ncbi:hypothetical protein N752_07160 [Desulforamulus aquiferis]|nr:hypothetical protein N752_07160 [Desulforamulus aquiferis]
MEASNQGAWEMIYFGLATGYTHWSQAKTSSGDIQMKKMLLQYWETKKMFMYARVIRKVATYLGPLIILEVAFGIAT